MWLYELVLLFNLIYNASRDFRAIETLGKVAVGWVSHSRHLEEFVEDTLLLDTWQVLTLLASTGTLIGERWYNSRRGDWTADTSTTKSNRCILWLGLHITSRTIYHHIQGIVYIAILLPSRSQVSHSVLNTIFTWIRCKSTSVKDKLFRYRNWVSCDLQRLRLATIICSILILRATGSRLIK